MLNKLSKNSRRRSNSKRKSRSKKSNSRRKSRSKKSNSRRKCEPITTEKICGPRRSCKYPNVWKRGALIKYSRKQKSVKLRKKDFKKIPSMTKQQLCSLLGLARYEEIQNYKIIRNKICGADKSIFTDAWTLKELETLAKEHGIKSRGKSRDRLCKEISDKEKVEKIKNSDIIFPFREKTMEEDIFYTGKSKYLTSFVYHLLKTHENLDIYISKNFSKDFFRAISYDCGGNITVNNDVIPQIKDSKKRFFLIYISIHSDRERGHANSLLYDRLDNTITLYDPLGKYRNCDKTVLNNFLESYFKVYLKAKFIPTSEICPKTGPQAFAANQRKRFGLKPNLDRHGLCAVFNFFTMDVRLNHPELSFGEVVSKILKQFETMENYVEYYINIYIDNVLEYKEQFKEEAAKKGIDFYRLVYEKCMMLRKKVI